MGDNILCPLCGSSSISYFAKHRDVPQNVYKCSSCGFYFVFPHESYIPGVTDGKEEHLWCSEDAYKEYQLWREEENKRLANMVIGKDSSRQIGKLLEIGFGDGPLTKYLLPNVIEYWGIEPIPESFAETIKKLNLDKNKLLCARAEDLDELSPFSQMENYFDKIVLISVFEHVSNPVKILENCYRLLSPSGTLVISTPDSKYFRFLYWMRRVAQMEPWSYFHISFFNEKNLEAVFKLNGFEILQKSRGALVTRQSVKYFRKYTNSTMIGMLMTLFRLFNLDRWLHIDTVFYSLKKPKSLSCDVSDLKLSS